MNWSDILYQWRAESVPDSHNLRDFGEYHYVDRQSKSLVITAGDSWTYGDSLPESTRTQEIYGNLVSSSLAADWINIGSRGRSNSWILKSLQFLARQVKPHYERITVVITLTENARDFETTYTFPFDYHRIYEQLGDSVATYETFLNAAETFWIEQINDIHQQLNCCIIIGQNFIWHKLYNLHPDITVLELNWVEQIADYLQIPRPIRTNLVTGWIFDKVKITHLIVPMSDITFKTWAIPYIEKANLVNSWLDSSSLNNKQASKHPKSLGHRIWADYILKHINSKVVL